MVSYSSNITMMHGQIYIRFMVLYVYQHICKYVAHVNLCYVVVPLTYVVLSTHTNGSQLFQILPPQ